MAVSCEELAQQIYKAELAKTMLPPLIAQRPEMTIEEAYRVQWDVLQRKVSAGARIVGKKTGLTSLAMQQMLKVDQPDFGHLTHTMAYDEHVPVPLSAFVQPRVEPEIAFVLKKDLKGPGVSLTQVVQATDFVVPALEIIDSRIENWQISIVDTIADNASSGGFMVGGQASRIEGLDLRCIGMNFYHNGKLTSTATGAAVLGNPLAAVAWLANALAPFDSGLQAGEIVLSGSLCAAITVKEGDSVFAVFDRLGTIGSCFA